MTKFPPFGGDAKAATSDSALIDEGAARIAKMREKGHLALTDEEAQANFDATIYAVEWDPEAKP